MPTLGQAWVEISANTAGFDTGIAKVRANLTNTVTGMGGEFGRLESAIEKAGHTLTRAFKFVVLYEGLREVGSEIRKLIGLGMEFNKQMETAHISLASSFMMNMNFSDQFGHAVSSVQALNTALGMSGKIIEKLRYDNLQTIATFQQMMSTFTASLPAGLHLGMTPNQVEQVSVRMMQVAGAQGWDMNSMGAQLRELLRGQVRATSPMSAIFSLDDIKKARGNAQELYDLIMKSTQAFALTGKLTQNTFEGMYSNLKSMFSEAAGRGLMGSFFTPLKGLMGQWLDNIATVNDQTKSIDFNPDFVAKFENIGRLAMSLVNSFSQIASVGLDIASTLGQWGDVISTFGTGLASALGVVEDFLKDVTQVKDALEAIAKLAPLGKVGGVQGAGWAGILGGILGAAGKIPLTGGLAGWAGAGAGAGLVAAYEGMRANQRHYSGTNTAEATIGLAGAGSIMGGTMAGTVSLGTLTLPGAAVGALIGAMTGLTSAIIANTMVHKPGNKTSITNPLPAYSPANAWLETALGAPEGFRALYGQQWEASLKNLSPDVDQSINKYSKQYNVPDRLVRAILGAESGFRQTDQYGNTLESTKGALGMGQIMPATAKAMGINPNDADQNIKGTAIYLDYLLKKFNGNLQEVAAGYNAGPGAVAKAGGIPNIPETQAYVSRVMGYMGLEGAQQPAVTATAKPNYKDLPAGQLDTMVENLQDRANNLSKTMSNQMQQYFIAFDKSGGQSFDAAAAQIQMRMSDLTATAWKQIEQAQKTFLADQKSLEHAGVSPESVQSLATAMGAPGHKGLTDAQRALKNGGMKPEDIKKLESAISALFSTWANGLDLVNFLNTNVSQQLISQAQLSDTLRRKVSSAELNSQYVSLTGNYKQQAAAQAELVLAQARQASLGKSPQEAAQILQNTGLQAQSLQAQANGSVFQDLMSMFNDQMRSLNPNLQMATNLFQDFNQSLNMVGTSVWHMISNFEHEDTFNHGKELGLKMQQLGFNVTNMIGQTLTQGMMQKYIEQPLMGMLGMGGSTSASGAMGDVAAAAQAAAEALWGVAGASGPSGAGSTGGGFLSNLFGGGSPGSGIMGLLSNLPMIGNFFGPTAAMSAAMAAIPFASLASSDAGSVASMVGADTSSAGSLLASLGMSLYADGGITSGPSIAGEAGPEAVVPLPGGRAIPVNLNGSAKGHNINQNITVHVQSTNGDTEAARQQGKEVARAIRAEIHSQVQGMMRPGGLLNQNMGSKNR